MPSLYIKLGLMKNFVKALAKQNSNGFEFLCEKFTELSQAQLKEGIFVGPQILEVFEDPEFENALNALELWAWHSFKWICSNFFENSSQIQIKVLQSCLWHTKRWDAAFP